MITLFVVVGGFASGVLLRSLFVFGWPVMAFALLLAGLMAIMVSIVEPWRGYKLAGLFFLFLALGAGRFMLADTPLPQAFIADVGTKVVYEGVIVTDPDMRDATQRIAVRISKNTESVDILVVTERYPLLAYGDTVRFEGALKLPEPFDTDGGRVFKYDTYLAKDGVRFIVPFAKIEVVEPGGFSFYGTLYAVKRLFNDALARALTEPSASLASGLILGGKQGLGEELKNAFTTSGLIHIVVLSGYNVMLVALAILWLFAFFSRRMSALFAGITILLFVLMAGAGAASVRAGLMACIGLYARATARTFDALRALLAVGLVMILWNPLLLVFDPGFELSFIATAGLIIGAPIATAHLQFLKNEFMREIAASTIAAQVAVLPLLLYQTGLFSFVALPANLLVLPLVPLAMLLSFGAGLISLLVPALSVAAGVPAYFVLSLMVWIAESLAALPLAAITLPTFPFWVVIAAYAAFGYFAWSKRELIRLQLMFSKNAST